MNKLTVRDYITIGSLVVGLIGGVFAFAHGIEVNSAELVRVNDKVDAVEERTKERIAGLTLTLRRMEDKLDRLLTK